MEDPGIQMISRGEEKVVEIWIKPKKKHAKNCHCYRISSMKAASPKQFRQLRSSKTIIS
jgi:hypothetical protein